MRLLILPGVVEAPNMDDDLRALLRPIHAHGAWDNFGRHRHDRWLAAATQCSTETACVRPATSSPRDKFITWPLGVGTWDYTPDEVLEKGRSARGELFVVDTSNGKIWTSFEDRRRPQEPSHLQAVDGSSTASGWCRSSRWMTPAPAPASSPDDRLRPIRSCSATPMRNWDQIIRVLGENGQEAVQDPWG